VKALVGECHSSQVRPLVQAGCRAQGQGGGPIACLLGRNRQAAVPSRHARARPATATRCLTGIPKWGWAAGHR